MDWLLLSGNVSVLLHVPLNEGHFPLLKRRIDGGRKSMTQQNSSIEQMRAITVSRHYGSGGGEVAHRLAERLQWQLFDHEAVVQVAQELGISHEEAAAQDEYAPDMWTRIIHAFQMVQPAMLTNMPPMPTEPDIRSYVVALQRVVDRAVAAGQVVLVGRETQMLLAGRRDVLHTRIVAPLEQRVRYVMLREGLAEEQARNRVQEKDDQRNRLLRTQFHESPDNPLLYDLVLNTGILSLDHAVELILQALEDKAQQLTLANEDLGPSAHMSRYTTQPDTIEPLTEPEE